MQNLSKNISFSNNGFTNYLVLKSSMVMFDIDYLNEKEILEKCNIFFKNHNLDLRIYRTKNGYRIFLTNKEINILSKFKIISDYTKELKGDMRYIYAVLFKQDKFAARIAPKYLSYINISESHNIEKGFINYINNSNESVSRYITSIGNGTILDDFKDFIEEHDNITKAFNENSILV